MNGHDIPGDHAVLKLRRRQSGNGKVLRRLRDSVASQVQLLRPTQSGRLALL
jgi:hypothetical protein